MASAGAAGGAASLELNSEQIKEFDTYCDRVGAQLDTTDRATKRMKELTRGLDISTERSDGAKLEAEAKRLVAESHKALRTAKGILSGMKTKAAAMESQGGASAITARVCLPRYKALLQRFIAATSASQQAKMAFKDVAVGRMVSQARMMKQFDHISTDEELRDEWERDPDLITKAITRTTHGSVRSAYVQAQEKSMEMKELLRDIEEVSKMAAEIAELVEARSETIQSIVGNVDMANDYVKQGERSLEKGLNSMRAARRRMCCFAIIAVVVLLIVSGVIGGVLGGA
uniref:t-SNARE coiled-coil homology domain-containing protein n=1 Tax=Cafeteria roenbergensis TaxID=33653 RepID=A0A7S0PCK6_CAFRO